MANSHSVPCLLPGGLSVDDRGQLTFVQGFNFANVRRFYVVENFSTSVVRAFHGHRREEKYVFALTGSAIVAAVELADVSHPDPNSKPFRFVLSARSPGILHIPAGFANGFRALEPKTRLLFFSSATLEDSVKDDYRFKYDQWGTDVWKSENR
ncbi:MAG TPA: dTDP-4-dehydrorhamnose 3,5-epimerase family protein [Candidatus Acidoferrales bacterium]|nr:dTDP-4-dehydrorhamnose 3,5-epimerase family protein [Candidatus Acidoferrales bacterium]